MIKVKLDNLDQINTLFKLLSLPGNDLDLEKEYDELLATVSRKEAFLKLNNFDDAARARQMELVSVKKIFELLNQKGILKEDALQIQFEHKLI